MRIAHIVCTYPPYYGGMGGSVFSLVNELLARGHDVDVFTPFYGDLDEDYVDDVERHSPKLSYGNAAWMPQIAKNLHKYDLVHLHYPFFGTATTIYRFKKKHPEIPLVITYHMDARGDGFKGLFFKLYAKWWMPRILGIADVLIATSFDYIESSDVSQLYERNSDKWREVPLGVDISRFTLRERNAELMAQFQLDSDVPTILFVGGMDTPHYFKGVPILLNALAQIQSSGYAVQALLVGDGNLREDFEAQRNILGLKNVTFLGFVNDEDLPFLYNACDVLVLPSTTQGEAFGLVLLEAMASGKPVVASDLPGVRGVASNGGVVVAPNNTADLASGILSILNQDRDEYLPLNIRENIVNQYSWKVVADKYEEIYTKLIF